MSGHPYIKVEYAMSDVPRPSIDYPKFVFESATALSESAQSAAVRKVRELGFDENQGEIPMEETFINLSTIRDVILDTVDKGRLTLLPLRLQSRLLQETNKVGQALVDLANGKDGIRTLENSVEDLNATIYQLNLQTQSESVLGFERKMNELKAQEVIVKRSMSRAVRLEKRLDEIEQIMNRLSGMEEQSKTTYGFVHDVSVKVDGLHADIDNIENSAKASAAVIDEFRSSFSKSAASGKEAAAELSTVRDLAIEHEQEIKELREQFSTLVSEAEKLKTATTSAVDTQIESLEESLKTHLEASTEQVEDIITKAQSRVSKLITDAEKAELQRETNATEQLTEILADFAEETRKALNDSAGIVAKHEKDTNDLITRLRKIEEQIDGAILKATGYTLFHTFQKRQENLAKSARLWAFGLMACVVLSATAGTIFLLYLKYFPSAGAAIYFKISLSLPFVAALTFCGWQYTIERRLEEEYAFKSNISLSLKPYQELVEEIIDENDPEERKKYTAFIISSINKVFTSPTGLVFDSEVVPGDEVKGLLKATLDGAKDIIKTKTGA